MESRNMHQPTLYDPRFEHDACGVGVVANIKGKVSHAIVLQGLEVLKNLAHRGALGADPETGDGAGILIQIPDKSLRLECQKIQLSLPPIGHYAVGMVFLPRGEKEKSLCETVIENTIEDEGQIVLGWRDVPVNSSTIGHVAQARQPIIRQILVKRGASINSESDFERKLYVIRKLVENRILESDMLDTDTFYIPSLSANRIVYKGLLIGTQVEEFYLDLLDENTESSFAIVHSRFSTNTLGSWKLAHPYRHIAHNGEINTLRGNVNWMIARQGTLSSPLFGDDLNKLFPIITPEGSDTSSIDNAIEFLLATGRSLPHVMMMLIPEAWGDHLPMDQAKRDFYEYHSFLMEPWDGPALIAFTDGKRVGAILDRNGLRPFRYLVTHDDLLIMASEVGVLDIPQENILYKGRIRPGRMFLLDPEKGGIIEDGELKKSLSHHQPYGEWLTANRKRLDEIPGGNLPHQPLLNITDRIAQQKAFGYSQEDLNLLMEPMATRGGESIGSMGNDVPLAFLSDYPQPLFNYFKQMFAQVSNPPLDAMREELVTSLISPLGAEGNLADETASHARQLQLKSPILTNIELEKIRSLNEPGLRAKTISIGFQVTEGDGTLQKALDSLCSQVSQAITEGFTHIVLSDRGIGPTTAAIPSLLATSGVHHHLIREGTRTRVGLIVESGEPREVAHFGLLIGYGAGAVNPYLAFETLQAMENEGVIETFNGGSNPEENYIKAINKGLLKIASKMGISTVQSYRGAQIFEAIGLGPKLISRYFTWTPSRVGGIDLETIEQELLSRHRRAYTNLNHILDTVLDQGGNYYWRRDGEYHMWNPLTIEKLQYATRMNDPKAYSEFAQLADEYSNRLCTLRGLFSFKTSENPVPLEEVEPTSEIVKRLATGGISLGAISREAHETLAIAMNRIGARSNSGEGGEDYRRYTPDKNGDRRHSAIKQVASGRFGVTINYLVNASDLQIKMAQGSKPGEGGQLPGHKIDDYIGWVRRSTPGVELISPPPHHDIYSIEDLAQLIFDLKNANSTARIHVKLVSEAGVGTIAAGVSKAHSDVVLISGDSGGTGASPDSSIKHAGLPWELGVAETQQVLVQNDLRSRIVVQADGQIKTARDVAIACLLGAEEFGIATGALVTLGCIMLRKCHLNTCSVGIATQDPELRAQFTGQPQHLINYFYFIADDLRNIMASLGFRTINEMVGRVDMLHTDEAINHWKATGLDLSALLAKPTPAGVGTYHSEDQNHGLETVLDNELVAQAATALTDKSPTVIDLPIRNSNRTVGTILSSEIARRYGEEALPNDTIQCNFRGSAGQSFGAFLAKGVTFRLEGDANDYLGKGISGGKLIVFPDRTSTFVPEENVITGNVNMYGATGGEVYIRGIAGERFCVRNSGVTAVVEGIGDHGCEYMTGGTVVILGDTGRNFAAGMSGGFAFIFDRKNEFRDQCNLDMVSLFQVEDHKDLNQLHSLVKNQFEYTGSTTAKNILDDWAEMSRWFVKVFPKDYQRVLEENTRKQRKVAAGG